jgi:hypothetical protein
MNLKPFEARYSMHLLPRYQAEAGEDHLSHRNSHSAWATQQDPISKKKCVIIIDLDFVNFILHIVI